MNKVLVVTLVAVIVYNILDTYMVFSVFAEPRIGDVTEFLLEHGYPVESHQVQTEDGYILIIHRIPHGRKESSISEKQHRPPVFLMHGLLCSSMDWLVLGPEKATGLVLADAGYDVWLGNFRGNTYSRHHITLDPDQDAEKFYDYSYHEIGLYDLPATIDYILSKTGYSKLTYIGYSQGFTSFTVMGSTRPEYNEKIRLMIAYAPVTNMHKITSLPINIPAKYPFILQLFKSSRQFEIFSQKDVGAAFRFLCRWKVFCTRLFRMAGMSKKQLQDHNTMLKILSNFPAGMSWKQITHYVQGTQTGTFRPFDYGPEINQDVYGQKDPPPYDLSKVTAPIIMYYGETDALVNNDFTLGSVLSKLPNATARLVPYPNFDHLDFIWGRNINLLNQDTLKHIDKVNR